jgi:hypothetical protein
MRCHPAGSVLVNGEAEMSVSSTPSQARPLAPVVRNMGIIGACIVLCAAGLVYAAGRYVEANAPAARVGASVVQRTFVGKTLSIPASWLRDLQQSPEQFATRIEMEIPLPVGVDDATVPVDVTLVPRSQVRPSSLLLDGVYLHQFLPNELSGPPGLVGKPLYGSDGFQDETVWYDPISADPFVAKCIAPVEDSDSSRCLRTVYLSTGIAAVYDFDASVLWSWRRFDSVMGRTLAHTGIAD